MKKRALIKILASLFIICLSLCVTFACGSDKNDSIQSESASSSDEHVHYYGVQVFDATCTKDGVIIFTCACGHTYTETITALGHTEVIDSAVAPTCESTGLSQGSHCEVCGEVLVAQEVIDALGHSYGEKYYFNEQNHWFECVCGQKSELKAHEFKWETIKEPTEEAEGEKLGVCACGYEKTSIIPELGHTHNYVGTLTAPTCTTDGFTTYLCRCGDNYVDNFVTAPGHTAVTDSAVAPTCGKDGLTEGSHCDVCGEVLVAQEVAPKTNKHVLGGIIVGDRIQAEDLLEFGGEELPSEQANCSNDGRGSYDCEYCGQTAYVTTYAYDKHVEVIDSAVAPTCGKDGLTEGSHCEACGEVLVAQEVVPKTNKHVLGGIIVGDRIQAEDLVEFGGEELPGEQANCSNDGRGSYDCERCGQTAYVTTYAYDKHVEVIDEAVAPTCESTGLTEGVHCELCEVVLVAQEVVSKLSHIYDNGKCSVCGAINVTPNEYFTFTLLSDDTYEISAKDTHNMPADIVIPSTYNDKAVTQIGNFYSCYTLTSVVIPNSVTVIGAGAFEICNSLTSIKISNSVTSIGYAAFFGCSSITSIEIPDSVIFIGEVAFCECNSLTSIIVDENNKNYSSLNGNLYNKDQTTLIQYAIGKTDKDFEIPDSVTYISADTFAYCASLTSIEIPEFVAFIGDDAFLSCNSLTSIIVNENNKNYSSLNGNLYNKDQTTLIQYAIGKTDKQFKISYSVTSIGGNAFAYCSSLASIEIPDSVTYIGNSAFESCSLLTSIEIPNSVTVIDRFAFIRCSSLTSVVIGSSVTSIDGYAFAYCSSLTSIVIPDSVTYIGEGVFAECNNLIFNEKDGLKYLGNDGNKYLYLFGTTSNEIIAATIDTKCKLIGDWAFSGCKSLASIEIPNSVISIGWHAFSGCSSLTFIAIPDSVTSISKSAFSCCDSLTAIVIPASVTSIDWYTFEYCSSLVSVYYKGTQNEWDYIYINDTNTDLLNATRYYYSESQPSEVGNFWHYNANGEIEIWEINNNTNKIEIVDGYIYFGEYPQTIKADSVSITSTTNEKGYFLGSDGAWYAGVTATPYASGYTFSNNASVISGATYYFKVEPIKWLVLSTDGVTARVVCASIIANHRFDNDTNNYAQSEIRAWLNNEFYNQAFSDLQKELIVTTLVENSISSTGYEENNFYYEYEWGDTEDKIYLLSYVEALALIQTITPTSDYSKAMGTSCDSRGYGWWWLRSPYHSYNGNVLDVYGDGTLYSNISINKTRDGVVPALQIKL